jgi:hypothetical protein
MKAIVKLKSFEGHVGIPGHQGGSLPRGMTLSKFESVIRNAATERAALVDTDGTVLQTFAGTDSHVKYDDISQFKDKVLVHNHPNNSYFSPSDIQFASESNVSQIRAVVAGGTYILNRPKEGWASVAVVADEYAKVMPKYNALLQQGKLHNPDDETADLMRNLHYTNWYYEEAK